MKTRVLIVDDEPLARERIRTLLRDEPEIEIAGECANGDEAVSAVRSQAPDLVFLTCKCPGWTGSVCSGRSAKKSCRWSFL